MNPVYLDDDRYLRVLRANFAKIERKTLGPEWQGKSVTDRYDTWIRCLWHLHCEYAKIRARAMEHEVRATRSVDEIFARFGMDW